MRASAIAEAVQQQKWDEVLALDTTNVAALIGRTNQRLNAATPDIEGAFEDQVRCRTTVNEIILDMDSSISPTHGQQEGTAYNGHFECTCYHPLF